MLVPKANLMRQLKPSDNKFIHKVVKPQDLNPEFEQKAR
jgi:hypothetical protein